MCFFLPLLSRPHHQELQQWASQLLSGKGVCVDDLQRKYETQVAVSELLRMLKGARPEAGGAAGASASGAAAAASLATTQPPARPVHNNVGRGGSRLDPEHNDLSFERDWDWDKASLAPQHSLAYATFMQP